MKRQVQDQSEKTTEEKPVVPTFTENPREGGTHYFDENGKPVKEQSKDAEK